MVLCKGGFSRVLAVADAWAGLAAAGRGGAQQDGGPDQELLPVRQGAGNQLDAAAPVELLTTRFCFSKIRNPAPGNARQR